VTHQYNAAIGVHAAASGRLHDVSAFERPRRRSIATKPLIQRSAQLFTIDRHRLHNSLQFRHHNSAEPHTSHNSSTGGEG
jgi:hypothetical protein